MDRIHRRNGWIADVALDEQPGDVGRQIHNRRKRDDQERNDSESAKAKIKRRVEPGFLPCFLLPRGSNLDGLEYVSRHWYPLHNWSVPLSTTSSPWRYHIKGSTQGEPGSAFRRRFLSA